VYDTLELFLEFAIAVTKPIGFGAQASLSDTLSFPLTIPPSAEPNEISGMLFVKGLVFVDVTMPDERYEGGANVE